MSYSSVWRTSHTKNQQNARPSSPCRYTAGNSVMVGKWDIKAESDAWLQSQNPNLEKVYCRSFPKSKDRNIYLTRHPSCHIVRWRVLSSPDERTILVHEIKSKRQEKHDGKHFVNLLTPPEDTG
ncbi:hypothetical protein WJX77_002276 [Trebouxia sp. C0004]